MIVAYTLTMPGRASYDGRWTGDDKLYVITRSYRTNKAANRAQKIIAQAPYFYTWGDGWQARIDAKHVDGHQAHYLRQKTAGFHGYDWMVDTIEEFGIPMARHEVEAHRKRLREASAINKEVRDVGVVSEDGRGDLDRRDSHEGGGGQPQPRAAGV